MKKLIIRKENWNFELKALRDFLQILDDWNYIIEVKKKTKRSLNQNNYYWVLLDIIFKETWNDTEYLHSQFKNQFLTFEKEVMNEKTWELLKYKIQKSTSELTIKEMEEYLSKIRIFSQDFLQIKLPLPNDNLLQEFYF